MKRINNQYALFDFCGTIVNFQSFNPYIIEVLKLGKPSAYKIYDNKLVYGVIKIATKLINKLDEYYYFDKHVLLFLTKGIHQDIFDEVSKSYYSEYVSKNFINETIELIRQCQNKNMRVIIVSAGCDLYITHFANEYNIDLVLANRIRFKNGKSMGLLDNKDFLGKRKILEINRRIKNNNINASFAVGVSDSDSDIPMLSICERKYVISNGRHQRWVTNEYEEIMYEK